MNTVTWDDFVAIDLRVGTVLEVRPFPETRKPAYQLAIDFGPELGIKNSSAQITDHYSPENLIGSQIIAVVNFPPRRIAGFKSEVLVTGLIEEDGKVVLLRPDRRLTNGCRVA